MPSDGGPEMSNKIWIRYVNSAFAMRLSIRLGILVCGLLIAPRLSAQVIANPELEIFSAPGATQVFTISVPSGTTLASFSVLTLGAPNLDFNAVASGTT